MKRTFFIIIILFIVHPNILFAQKKANLEGIKIGMKAPEIELPTVDGEIIKLSQSIGKIVLVNFWASWCPPCREEMPHFIKIQ